MTQSLSSLRPTILLALGALLALTTPAAAREKLTGEQQLAKILKDRVPGKPVDCVMLNMVRSSTIIDKTAIVYDAGSVIYVNRPSSPDTLDDDDIMVTKTWGAQLCRLDMVQMYARSGMFWHGTVGLENFVPYTRVKAPKPPKVDETKPAAPPAAP